MGRPAVAALFIVTIFLVSQLSSQTPPTEGQFKTFITVSVDNTKVIAKVSYFDVSYYYKVDEEELKAKEEEVKASKDLSKLYEIREYSDRSFGAKVSSLEGAEVFFTFEGKEITDSSGNQICNPELSDAEGMVSCNIQYYKDPVDGSIKSIDGMKSCGQVLISTQEFEDGKLSFLPFTTSTVVCPAINMALSAFGPAIRNGISSNILLCFPAILIAGLLLASMYYSGKDPLSLFDITVPRLPRVQTFRVRGATAPQMLRSVLRKYKKMRKLALKGVIRTISRHAKLKGGRAAAKKAKKEVRDLFKRLGRRLNQLARAGATADQLNKAINSFREELHGIFEKYRVDEPKTEHGREVLLRKAGFSKRYLRKLKGRRNALKGKCEEFLKHLRKESGVKSGDLFNQYVNSFAAIQAQTRARGSVGKGSLISRKIVNPVLDKSDRAVRLIEDSKFGNFVRKIPVVRGFVAVPGKINDSVTQFIGSKRSIKAVKREHAAGLFRMMTRTKFGKSTEKGIKGLFVRKGKGSEKGKLSKFGKSVEWLLGFDYLDFEERGKAEHVRLAKFYDVLRDNMRDEMIHRLNDEFKSHFARIMSTISIRGTKEGEIERHLNELENKIDVLKKGIRVKGGKDKHELFEMLRNVRSLIYSEDLAHNGRNRKKIENLLSQLDKGLGVNMGKDLQSQISTMLINERIIAGITQNKKLSMQEKLEKLHYLAIKENAVKKSKYFPEELNSKGFKDALKEFKLLEKDIKSRLLVMQDKNGYYKAIQRSEILADDAHGMGIEELEARYGKALVQGLGLGKQTGAVIKATNASELKKAISELRQAIEGEIGKKESDYPRKQMLNQMLNLVIGMEKDFGGIKAKQFDKITPELLARLRMLEKIQLKEFDSRSDRMAKLLSNTSPGGWLNSQNNAFDRLNEPGKLGFELKGDEKGDLLAIMYKSSASGKNISQLYLMNKLEHMFEKAKIPRVEWESFLYDVDKNGERTIAKFKNVASLVDFFDPAKISDEKKAFYKFIQHQLGKDPQALYQSLLSGLQKFNQAWVGYNYAVGGILHGGKDKEGKSIPLKYLSGISKANEDLMSNYTLRNNYNYLLGEKGAVMQKFGYAADAKTRSMLQIGMLYEHLAGFSTSGWWEGASMGHNLLGMLEQTHKKNADHLNRYNAFFLNLINYKSKYYDAEFVQKIREKTPDLAAKLGLGMTASEFNKGKFDRNFEEMKGKPMDSGAYNALLERGYLWVDRRRGLGSEMRADRRVVPFIQYDKSHMQDGQDILVLKSKYNNGRADIRDFTKMLASTPASNYSSRESGMVILTKDKDGKWLFGNPMKAEHVEKAYQTAESEKRLVGKLSESLAGGKADQASLKVVSVSDFANYAKDKRYSDIFGKLSSFDRGRETFRSGVYSAGLKLADFMYTSFAPRIKRMEDWYSAQYQVRQGLQRMAERAGELTKHGEDRFKVDEKFFYGGEVGPTPTRSGIYEDKVTTGKAKHMPLKDAVYQKMEELKQGDGSFIGNAKAFYYKFRRSIAAKTLNEISEQESKWYSANLELRALKELQSEGAISKSSFTKLSSEVKGDIDFYKEGKKEAQKQYKEFNRELIEWTGSHSTIYGSKRSVFTMYSIPAKMFDSKYAQGLFMEHYNIAESSTMRDPRTALGAGEPGHDWISYVGYQTGQNVYERANLWATNAMWEKNAHTTLNFVYAVHKWWNDKVSFAARTSSGYPPPVSNDMISAPHWQTPKVSSWFTFPFKAKTFSDFFHARQQSFMEYSGLTQVIGAYQKTGITRPGDSDRGFLKNLIDKGGKGSEWYYNTPYNVRGLQRLLDKTGDAVKVLNDCQNDHLTDGRGNDISLSGAQTIGQAFDKIAEYKAKGEEEKAEQYVEGVANTIKNNVDLDETRRAYVLKMMSGRDISEDGAKGRFLDLYIMFHTNVFSPTVPGMWSEDPITARMHAFPQISRKVQYATGESPLAMMKNYYTPVYEDGKTTFKDQFTTRQDSMQEAYREDTTSLLHLMKMQHEELAYSPLNSRSLTFFNPLLFAQKRGLRALYYRLAERTPLGSTVLQRGPGHSDPYGRYKGTEAGFDDSLTALTGEKLDDIVTDSAMHHVEKQTSTVAERFKSCLPRLIGKRKETIKHEKTGLPVDMQFEILKTIIEAQANKHRL